MVLYAADLVDFEKPKPIQKENVKPVETKAEPKVEPKVEVKKEKKPLTEKQLAALAKGQETRRLKKEQAVKEKEEMEALEKKLVEAAPKKKRKITEKVVEKVVEVPTVEVPVKRKAPRKKTTEPPEWFTKYVEGVQKEKVSGGAEVSKKQETIIKNEALKVAQKSWDSGFTRDRVQNEVDSHSIQFIKLVNRMYSMIFSR